MKKVFLLLFVFLGLSLTLDAQRIITGKVTDENQNPLAGVSVMVKESTIGTLTESDGSFRLSVPESAKVLSFSFIGMKPTDVEIGTQTNFSVSMSVDIGLLEEVIVIGYGTVKKKDLTGAVTRLNAEELQTEASANVTTMLRGAIPGLAVNLSTTAKGLSDPMDMEIRGETSLRADDSDGTDAPQRRANAPLVVVDGMIYYGDLSDINPVDIESFDILKDASSAAIYGARASNGVILITTKRGFKGKPIINVSTSTGIAYPSHKSLDMMTGEQHIARRIAGFEANERRQLTKGPGYYNSYNDLPSGVTLDQWKAYDGSSAATNLDDVWLSRIGFAPIEINNYKAGKITDFKQYTWQTGLTQDYNLSLSGSGDAVSYYWSLGYTDNEGIRYNEEFKTIRSRLNLEATVTKFLKTGINAQMAFRDESPISPGNSFFNTPYSSMFEDDGVTLTLTPSGYINAPNFWLEMRYRDRFRKYNTLSSKIYGTLTLPFGISFTSEFIPRFNWNREYNTYSSEHFEWALQGGRATRSNTTLFEWQINNMLKWNKTFGDHVFDFTFVQNAEQYQYWYELMNRRNFQPSDVLGYHRMQAATEDVEISSNDETSTGDALLARLNYNLKSKYNLTGSYRRDGYSAFGQANPHASFWSVAGGWTISEESFFTLDMIDQLKLRLSYGVNGNRGVGIYDALSNLNSGKFLLITNGVTNYVSQLYTSRMANANLKWERTSAYNAGLDFAILKGRLTGTLEAYYSITKDLIIPRQLPNITGYASVFSNMGQVDNTGVELSLSSVNIATPAVTWSSDFTMSHNKNKIVHLFGDMITDPVTGAQKEVDDITNEWFIGHAVDEVWDYRTLGIWQESEADQATAFSRNVGDYKLEDLNGDGKYTNDDKQFLGFRRPKFRLSLRNTVTFRNFELSVKMYSYLGHLKADNYLRNNEAFYDRGTYYNVPYWTPANPGNKWARVDSYETNFNVWEKNSFVRLDNVSLSYNVPKSLLSKISVASCRLSIVADNPFVISPEWSWMDPENDSYTPSYLSFKLNLTL
ncbi:MAG TPA: SusC/RagA family TonB-linked outer membrane protein [Bacteroidales bacterium]|nr:SusC/RagA family TonB-linked outer membrane protein [Bacteroidales bacterium]